MTVSLSHVFWQDFFAAIFYFTLHFATNPMTWQLFLCKNKKHLLHGKCNKCRLGFWATNPDSKPKISESWNELLLRFWYLLMIAFLRCKWTLELVLLSSFKGHLISKCLFGVFNFSQKTNENKSTWGIIVVKSNFFVRFFGRIEDTKKSFWN